MDISRQFESIPNQQRPVFCAIGMFDGIHLGHQLLLEHIREKASEQQGISVVLTFQDHPARVLAPKYAPGMIYPGPIKERLLEEHGVDLAWIIPFDLALSQLDPEVFIKRISDHCGHLAGICVGQNFAFGHQRKGNLTLLKQLGASWGFEVEGKAPVMHGQSPVSSTRIRKHITEGAFPEAAELLGRPYQLTGTIVHGDGLGRKLGFPTANLDGGHLTLPPCGVYAVVTQIQGRRQEGVLNIGYRPTLKQPDPSLQVEAHFWDLDQDLYGSTLSLEIVEKIRDEQRFPNVEALKHQIAQDIATAKASLQARSSSI